MKFPKVSIVMRSFNEGWALQDTLAALKTQEFSDWELIVIDSGSTDGSVELIENFCSAHFVRIASHEYNPSRVMNHGVRLAKAETIVFLNADATPQGNGWLGSLYQALQSPTTAAVFSRQIPRPDCQAVFAHDYDRCFGDERESANWEHFFSMVSSGIRKDVWEKRGFREDLQYAEDDEYTRWCRSAGYEVCYVPKSVVMHSHNYTTAQAYRRAAGDARAMAATYRGRLSQMTWIRAVLAGFLSDFRRDVRWFKRRGCLGEIAHAMRIRVAQRFGAYQGFHEGWKQYGRSTKQS